MDAGAPLPFSPHALLEAPVPEARSLIRADVAAPAIMAAAGLLAIVEAVVAVGDLEVLPWALAFLGPCTAGTTVVAYGMARGRKAAGLGAALVIALVHALVVAAFTDRGSGAVLAGIPWGVTAGLATPMLLVLQTNLERHQHDSGDVILGAASAWLVILNLLALCLIPSHVFVFLPCALIAAVPGVVASVRGARRRRWCERVARGELQGWRARPLAAREDLSDLAPVYGERGQTFAVLERVEVAPAGGAYRDGFVTTPMALAPELALSAARA